MNFKRFITLGFIYILCNGCNDRNAGSKSPDKDSFIIQEELHGKIKGVDIRNKIPGSWVDQSEENDTMVINKDSIFSFLWIESAPYSIDSTMISIGDERYNRFLLSLKDDTLTFIDQDGKQRKYSRLRNK